MSENKPISDKQLIANRKNALKSTGPKTEEGKEISSMNAVKSGKTITKFWRINGNHAGKMSICDPCGDEQKEICKACQKCELQDAILLQNLKTFKTKNLYHLEMLNMTQVATMDFFFSMKLRELQSNMYKVVKTKDQYGNDVLKSAVTNDDMILLMNMASHLGKTPDQMQLTRKSQDMADVAWADLAKAQINPEEAAKFKEDIKKSMIQFREKSLEAEDERSLDEAIQQHRKQTGEVNEKQEENMSVLKVPDNPFGNSNNG